MKNKIPILNRIGQEIDLARVVEALDGKMKNTYKYGKIFILLVQR